MGLDQLGSDENQAFMQSGEGLREEFFEFD